jgi:hypothetical protein
MSLRKLISLFTGGGLIALLMMCAGCETGVEDSPDPGIVRVILKANPSDTYIVERSDTFSVYTPYETTFNLNIFQGSVFTNGNVAVLYKTTQSYMQEDSVYNFVEMTFNKSLVKPLIDSISLGTMTYSDIKDQELQKFVRSIFELDSGKVQLPDLQAAFKGYVIFESFIPPGNYDQLRFGINAPTDEMQNRLTIVTREGKKFYIPVEIPPEEDKLITMNANFEVKSGQTTEIYVEMDLFKGITRYRDSYRLHRNLQIKAVKNL